MQINARRNPRPAGDNPRFSVYGRYGHRKGVAQWIVLLGWVRLVTRYNKNTHMPQLLQRFRPVRPMWEFPAICPETR